MPCTIAIMAADNPPWKKGYPVDVLDGSRDLSNWVNSKFVQLFIPDAEKAGVEHFIQNWRTNFNHEILGQNAQGYRIKISVDPRVVSVFGLNKGVAQSVIDELTDNWGAVVFDVHLSNHYVTVDIPKPVDLQALKNRILDIFEQDLDVSLYYFTDADVDEAIAAGGKITMNKAQVLARVKNRLID